MNVTILGGGTAGWLTALFVKKYHPQYNVTLIESSDIGILGAGEGTTPHFPLNMEDLDIDIRDIIKHCDGTVKNGINFINWNGDSKSYFHGFINQVKYPEEYNYSLDRYYQAHMSLDKPGDDAFIGKALSINNQAPMSARNPKQYNAAFGFHFNARKLAEYLKSIAVSRGVILIDGNYKNVIADENNNITKLCLEDGREVVGDFVFDCSGFARLLIGKHYQSKWISYSDSLPLNTAIPFFIPHDNTNITPETKAIAMKYGWVWQIPVRDRYGCGYVFDSSYITEEQALEEASNYYGMELTSPKTFKFSPGCYDRIIYKNCAAAGLAQGFVEPLEATSIWVTLQFLKNITYSLPYIIKGGDVTNLNQNLMQLNEQVREFLQLHYITKRGDSKFWTDLPNRIKIIPSLQEKLDHWYNVTPTATFDPKKTIFGSISWYAVTGGLELLNKKAVKNELLSNIDISVEEYYNQINTLNDKIIKSCFKHDDYISYCCNR